jgi:IPT/TIG domain
MAEPTATISNVAGTYPGGYVFVSGGDLLTITGTTLLDGPLFSLSIDRYPCTNYTFVNSTTVTCVAPAMPSTGTYNVRAATNGNGSAITISGTISIDFLWDPSRLENLVGYFVVGQANDGYTTVQNGTVTDWCPRAGSIDNTFTVDHPVGVAVPPEYASSAINGRPGLKSLGVRQMLSTLGSAAPYSVSVVAQVSALPAAGATIWIVSALSDSYQYGVFNASGAYEFYTTSGNPTSPTAAKLSGPTSSTWTNPFSMDALYSTPSSGTVTGFVNGSDLGTGAGLGPTPTLPGFGFVAPSVFGGYLSALIMTSDNLSAQDLSNLSTWRKKMFGVPG